jgi:hypothetical protein
MAMSFTSDLVFFIELHYEETAGWHCATVGVEIRQLLCRRILSLKSMSHGGLVSLRPCIHFISQITRGRLVKSNVGGGMDSQNHGQNYVLKPSPAVFRLHHHTSGVATHCVYIHRVCSHQPLVMETRGTFCISGY